MTDARLLSEVQAEAARRAHWQALAVWAETMRDRCCALRAAVPEVLAALDRLGERALADPLRQAYERVGVANAQVAEEPWKSWLVHVLDVALPSYTVPDDIPESVLQRVNEWLVAWQELQAAMEDVRAAFGEAAA